MKNIKEIVVAMFALVGVFSIINGFTTKEQSKPENNVTPESHVWEGLGSAVNNDLFIYNKVTGEVRSLGDGIDKVGKYKVMEVVD